MKNKAVQQYLARYAESEVALLDACLSSTAVGETLFPCQFGLVIPCYHENPRFLARFIAQFSTVSVCLVVVLNQPDSSNKSEPQRALLEWITTHVQPVADYAHLSFFRVAQLSVVVIKRFEGTLRIATKQGVGLARKMGTDVLAALVSKGLIGCSVVGSTDADAWLPANYFSTLQNMANQRSAVAGVFDFEHGDWSAEQRGAGDVILSDGGCQASVLNATALYEQWLHYYVAGLRFAGSQYGFYTIGSCLAFDCVAYCQVRGFPARAGGEDFYLLNKLAKLATGSAVQSLPERIRLQARVSDRVPFGTGPAVKKLLEDNACENTFQVYSPKVFEVLAELLEAFNHLWLVRNNPGIWLQQRPVETQQALIQLGWPNNMTKILAQCRSSEQLRNQIQGWFDGFRTLRFIHLLERLYFSPVSLRVARQSAKFTF